MICGLLIISLLPVSSAIAADMPLPPPLPRGPSIDDHFDRSEGRRRLRCLCEFLLENGNCVVWTCRRLEPQNERL
jgi:hypothetical protein